MKEFKVGDLVRVIKETENRYVGEVDTIEETFYPEDPYSTDKHYYLQNCHLEYEDGERLFFYESELELYTEFYWMKKSNNERI